MSVVTFHLQTTVSFLAALWNRAESVELILPNSPSQNFRTKKHFSYYKFFVPEDVDHFRVVISGCRVRLRQRPLGLHGEDCIDYVAMRGKVRQHTFFSVYLFSYPLSLCLFYLFSLSFLLSNCLSL